MVPKSVLALLIGALAFFLLAGICVLVLTFLPGLGATDLAGSYAIYHKAIQDEDISALKELVAAEKRNELLGDGVEMKLKMIKEMMPAEFTVKSQQVVGKKGKLKLESFAQGQKMSCTVDLVKEDGTWKITKENWRITISGGFFGAAQPLFTDPAKPPQAHVTMQDHQGAVSKLVFSPDGQFLVSISYDDYTIRSWEPVTGTQISSVKTKKRPSDLAITPDGQTIITADAYKNIETWSFASGRIARLKTLVTDAGDSIALSRNGTLLAATAFDHPIGIWQIKDGKPVATLDKGRDQRVLCFGSSNKILVSGGGTSYSVWEGRKWQEDRHTIAKVSGDMFGLDISRDGTALATAHGDSSIVLVDLPGRQERYNFCVKDAATLAARISPDGKILATANKKDIYLWDVTTGKQKACLKGHDGDVKCLAFGPGGSTLASGSGDRKIILWRGGPPPATTPEKAKAPKLAIKPGKMLTFRKHQNLVRNSSANQDTKSWRTNGDASIEPGKGGNPHFSIKHKASFSQDVLIPGAAGKFAAIVARASSARKNERGDQTGYPYLYGYWVHNTNPNKFNGYLQGQEMRLTPTASDRWGVVSGVFQIPPDTGSIRLLLQQADGKSAQDGSAARFDDVGIYLFANEAAVKRFLRSYATKAKTL